MFTAALVHLKSQKSFSLFFKDLLPCLRREQTHREQFLCSGFLWLQQADLSSVIQEWSRRASAEIIYSHNGLAAPGSPQIGNGVQLGAAPRPRSLQRERLQTHCRPTHPNLPGAQIILTELCSAACWKLQPPLVPVARVICPWKTLFFQWRQESKLCWTQNPRRGRLSSGKPHLQYCFPSNDASGLCCLLQSRTHSPGMEGRTSVMDWKAIALHLKCWRNSLFSVYYQAAAPAALSGVPSSSAWHDHRETAQGLPKGCDILSCAETPPDLNSEGEGDLYP